MEASWGKFRILVLLALLAAASGMSYGAEGDDEGLPALFSAAKGVRDESRLAVSLGDQYIAWGETNNFSAGANEDIGLYIDKQLGLLGSSVIKERELANRQIQRLWRLSVPKLIENLGHANSMINDAVMKNLIMMRNKGVITSIIQKVNESPEPRVRYSGVFALGMMMEKRKSAISNREVLDEAGSAGLANNVIKPFLTELLGKTDDETLKKIIRDAQGFLAHPAYRSGRPDRSK